MSAYDPNSFTSQSNKAIGAALEFAQESKNVDLVPLHLAYTLFTNRDGLGFQLITKCESDSKEVELALKAGLKKLSRQDPAPENIHPNSSFLKVLKTATKYSAAQKDSHTAVDHLILALYEDTETSAALSQAGLAKSKMEKAIKAMRGSKKVNSNNAENSYAALDKYCIDLIKLASDGKIDPVIGRDQEIRRVIQILSR